MVVSMVVKQGLQLEFWKVLHVDDLMITITLKAAANNGRLMNTYEAKVSVNWRNSGV
ncbi:hypothetical protein Hanom_Chr03g00274711 [Helianthus anomalus]